MTDLVGPIGEVNPAPHVHSDRHSECWHGRQVQVAMSPAPPKTTRHQCCGWGKKERKELLWRNTPQGTAKKNCWGFPGPAANHPSPTQCCCSAHTTAAVFPRNHSCLRTGIAGLNTDGGWCLLGSHHCRGTRAGMFGCSRRKNSRNFLQPKKTVPGVIRWRGRRAVACPASHGGSGFYGDGI